MNPKTSKLAAFLASASLLTLANVLAARAGEAQTTQEVVDDIPETVLITGSLIRGTAAVGVPVTELRTLDFIESGALTTADLFRTFPAANVQPGPLSSSSGANIERSIKVNIRGLDTGSAARNLMMVDGMRVPAMSNGVCTLDPSIIPSLAVERIDVLVDGASATYGSDAIGGVINIILKRNFDGAMTQLRYTRGAGGKNRYQAAGVWGRTWDGGQVTLTYEWHDDSPIHGNFHSQLTVDFTPWGLDSRIPIGSSLPGTISIGAPAQPASLGLSTGTNATFGTGCTNCYAIPPGTGANWDPGLAGFGPTAPFSASTLDWSTFATAANGGSNGTRNIFNPYTIAWYDVAEQSNRAVITLDQRLTPNISFYGEGYYSNRRTQYYNPANQSPTLANILSVPVPTFNPYYPTGGAPTNLRVNYNSSWEKPGYTSSYQVDHRYQFGLNIALPGDWAGKVYYAQTYTSSHNFTQGGVNKAGVSAALGWTISGTPAAGSTPAVTTWSKPASVPYLNLFCDPMQFQCNSPDTLAYATGVRIQDTKFIVNEKGVNFDGPLFDLPGGVVKAAIGATYTSFPFVQTVSDNTSAPNLLLPYVVDPRSRSVWATFTQVNVPVIGESNALPGIARFEVEGSWRHDQYSDFGGTSNAKAAFNWLISENIGLMIRGAWGQSFRAPSYADTSAISGFVVQGWALPPAIYVNSSTIPIECTGGLPVPGSAAEKLFNAGFACGSQPQGISFTGGGAAPIKAGWRDFVNQDQRELDPEQAVNWSLGFDYTPTGFLAGLNLQATWYSIKISGVLGGFPISASQFNTAGLSFATIVPSDVGCPASADAAPTTCANFQSMVAGLLSQPRSQVPLAAQTLVYWLNDGGIMNKGWLKLDGIDWSASYDWDLGGIGAFNVGVIGTYYLHRQQVAIPGAPGAAGEIQDAFHTTIGSVGGIAQEGVPNMPRMRYRARLGWSNGTWSITGFMDYRSHYFHANAAPPNVNFQCVTAGGTVGGGTFPCLIDNYTNIVPSHYTFDISIGYNTGDSPANEYLRNIGVQIVVQNVTDKHPAFAFATGIRPGAWENLTSGAGRWTSLILTKTW